MLSFLDSFEKSDPFIIAEVAQSHEGSLGVAHSFIDAVADAKADAIKFQTHIASAESTRDEPWRVKFSRQDASRYDYWKRMEFTAEQWAGLKAHAEDRGLIFLSSPFSTQAVDLLNDIGITAWKVASGEVNNPEIMQSIIRTKKPIILSSGMSTEFELDQQIAQIKKQNIPCMLLQCTTEYPSEPENWGLSFIKQFANRFQIPVGFSDHSGEIFSLLASTSLGARILEVHVTFHKKAFGPDVPSSITLEKLEELVLGSRKIAKSLKSTKSKEEISAALQPLKTVFGRSLALNRDLRKGEILSYGDLTLKKPGYGIPHEAIESVVGRRLRHDKGSDTLLKLEDLE